MVSHSFSFVIPRAIGRRARLTIWHPQASRFRVGYGA